MACNWMGLSMVSKGLFIVCDGMDGCGKSTQATKLVEWIFSNYKKVDTITFTREPTQTKYGIEIRQRLGNMQSPEEGKERLLELYVLDREQHVDNVIVPMLNQKAVVVCDRYKYSTIVYQAAQGVPISRTIEDNAGFPIPDIALIFNASVDSCMQRLSSRGQITDGFEKREFLEKLKSGYAKLPQLLPKENIMFINANQSIEQVHQDTIKAVKPLLDAISK